MAEEFATPSLVLPFKIRGLSGEVNVYYGRNTNSERWGCHLLKVPYDPHSMEGFPIIQADVWCEGEGNAAVMAWIQLVTVQDLNTGHVDVSLDGASVVTEVSHPFSAFGYKPTLFETPGPNPTRSNEKWTAHSYLTFSPDVSRGKEIMPVRGVCWGYTVKDGTPSISPVGEVTEKDWQKHCQALLTPGFSEWTFAQTFSG